MDEKTQIRDRILNAAMARIRHYGYGKTTMAEIASDCEMSPGNIYRFFESKIDIAEAMARRVATEENIAISAIARRKDLSIEERLRRIFLERVRIVHNQLSSDPKTLEMAEVLGRERPLYFREMLGNEVIILSALVAEGMEQGLFEPGDPNEKAEMLQLALTRFSSARMLFMSDLPSLERRLQSLLDLIFHGLLARPKS
jgi:AcrR family transcriptional regulator